ncbi:MAG: gamma carbonic anhydrase family protein [Pseudomonadota bacterium]
MALHVFKETKPEINDKAFVADGAALIGNVKVAAGATIWFNAVLRADINEIEIGANSNVQDCACIHVSNEFKTKLGEYVTVGHNAVVHGSIIGDNTLIGMGAVLNDGCVIGRNCVIGSGAVLAPKSKIEDNSLVVGVPGKVVKTLGNGAVAMIKENAAEYVNLGKAYKS